MRGSRIKRLLSSLTLALCLNFFAIGLCAQEASKIDEVIKPRCDLSEAPQITDPPPNGRIFAALDADKSAQAAIVVYGMEGDARRYAEKVKRWLTKARGVEAARLVQLYGGPSDERRLELWLVPHGASLPRVNNVADDKRAIQFASFSYWSGEYCGSERFPALRTFAEALGRLPGWQGYIIVRPHRNPRRKGMGDEGWDPDGYLSRRQALRRAARDRLYTIRKFGLSPARLRAVVGDKDDWTHAELWLVPPGVEPQRFRMKSSKKG